MDRTPERPERADFEICASNLAYLDRESGLLRRQADAVYADCVRVILQRYRKLPSEEAAPIPVFFSAFVNQHLLSDDLLPADRNRLLFRLCRALAGQMSDPEIREALHAFLHIEQPSSSGPQTILYVHNPQIGAALDSFSSVFPKAGTVRCANFSDGCEDVASGNADACVIPLISSGEGLLSGFVSTLDRYDLKITNLCSVSSPKEDEPGRFTVYALARRDLILPREDTPCKAILELYPAVESSMDFLPLNELGPALSVSLIQSVPGARLDGTNNLYLILDTGSVHEILPFLQFLREAKVAYAVLGLCPDPKH